LPYSTDIAVNQLVLTNLAAIATFENERRKDQQRQKIQAAKKNGKYFVRKTVINKKLISQIMNTDYNKKRYLQLWDQSSIGDNSNENELSKYSIMLTNQLDWEIKDQYLSLMKNFVNGNISICEFFAELCIKNYTIINAVTFLEKHRIFLSFDKKASKFGELLEDVLAELEGEYSYTDDKFKNFIPQKFIQIKQYLNEE
jgi:hypothetical protein